jgi:hypothetical protein
MALSKRLNEKKWSPWIDDTYSVMATEAQKGSFLRHILLLGQDRKVAGLLGNELAPVSLGKSTSRCHPRSWHASTLFLLSSNIRWIEKGMCTI